MGKGCFAHPFTYGYGVERRRRLHFLVFRRRFFVVGKNDSVTFLLGGGGGVVMIFWQITVADETEAKLTPEEILAEEKEMDEEEIEGMGYRKQEEFVDEVSADRFNNMSIGSRYES